MSGIDDGTDAMGLPRRGPECLDNRNPSMTPEARARAADRQAESADRFELGAGLMGSPIGPQPVYEIERDRYGLMYSGPLEVGECVRVVPITTPAAPVEDEREWDLALEDERGRNKGEVVTVVPKDRLMAVEAERDVE